MGTPSQAMVLRGKYIDAPTVLTSNGSSQRNSTVLTPGIYVLTCDGDGFFQQGGSSITASTSSIPLWSKTYVDEIYVESASDGYIAVYAASTTKFYIFERNP